MVRDWARNAGLGRLAYLGWHAPRGFVRRVRGQGVVNLGLAEAGRRAMERAVPTLPPAPAPTPDAPEVFFLTGRRFAYQTAFCALSLARAAGHGFRVVVVDDGTLSSSELALLGRLLPGLRHVGPAEITAALDRRLPAGRFPELRRRRLVYPHLRKLTDVHAAGGGWKLVLDSDMLFHRRPDFLLDWLAAPDRPCHMLDLTDAYGYSAERLRRLAGGRLPERVNVGICGLHSDALDWEAIERWSRTLLDAEGFHYLLEQALVALATAHSPRAAAPEQDYIVAPTREEARRPRGVLHHYTAESKAWYFRYGWRHMTRPPVA